MSYYSAKQKYEQENKTDLPRYVCTVCMMEAEHKDMVTYGARCWKCYDDYCKSAPRYQPQPVFAGDQKDWARSLEAFFGGLKPCTKKNLGHLSPRKLLTSLMIMSVNNFLGMTWCQTLSLTSCVTT